MGGKILVESQLGIGSKFTIRLPAELVASARSASSPELAIAFAMDAPLEPQTVLVIGHDSAARKLLLGDSKSTATR